MESGSSNLSILAPPVFYGENYQAWAMRMQSYMEGCDYWEAIEEDFEVTSLSDKLSSFAHEISEEHAEEPRKKNLSQEIKRNVQL
ncbi:hypothetical protein PVK06_046436 [Gossypium arboreum]|uniref:DUF4219 domain-containing protein n=1 Tax=Gossypium arboreum TaxID=29729 RepID=A0ABR0MAL9_GOSAR|nr:hypothetical protein PVK06_046436 [Gossypium arboreum]